MKEKLVVLFQNMACLLSENKKWTVKSSFNHLVKISYKYCGMCIKNFFSYDFFALSFNQEFFLKNFLKNLLLFDFLRDSGCDFAEDILDVGCGAAPAGVALSLLTFETRSPENHLHINLLDKSYRQLELAKALCKELSIDVSSYQKSAFHFGEQQYDKLVLFSYFVCEQERSFIKLLYEHRNLFKCGFIILDYKYIIERIRKTFERHEDAGIHIVCLRVPLPEGVSDILQEKEVKIYGCYFDGKQ